MTAPASVKLAGLLWLLLAATVPLAAQGKTAIGVELGYTRASFSGRDSRGVTLHEGAAAGAYFQVRLAPWLAVRPGLQITSKGGATSVVPTNSTDAVQVDLDLVYLDLPILLRSGVPLIGRTRLILTGGVVPSLRIGCNVEVSDQGVVLSRSKCQTVSVGVFRSFDFQGLAGAGLGIPIENSELAVEARFTQGFPSISDIADIKNRALTFIISVPF